MARSFTRLADWKSAIQQIGNLRYAACAAATLTCSPFPSFAAEAKSDPGLPYVYTKWEQITTQDGLPNDHIFAVKADPAHNCVWFGTADGLARYDKKTRQIQCWREKDGLPWRVITGIDVDPKTGDLWLGLFGGGLARFSAGRFDSFTQLNSGLVNDVVYAVAVEDDHVWCATTAGASRYNTKTDKWDIFTEKNAPMEEIWNYNVCARDGKVYPAVWGSGCSNSTSKPKTGSRISIRTARWKSICIAMMALFM